MALVLSVLSLLEQKGWQVDSWRDGWIVRDEPCSLTVYVSATPQWVCLICSSITEQYSGTCSLAQLADFYQHLLTDNGRMFLVKLGLDDDKQPLLMAEIASECLSLSLFEWSLSALRRYQSTIAAREDNMGKRATNVVPLAQQSGAPGAPGIPKETLQHYLRIIKIAGWHCVRELVLQQSWHLLYIGMIRTFDVCLTITKSWCSFEVPILPEVPAPVLATDASIRITFLEYLLRLNSILFMAKLALSEDGQVLLLVECPTKLLEPVLFELMASTLASYLNRFEKEINIMAFLERDPRLLNLLVKKRSQSHYSD